MAVPIGPMVTSTPFGTFSRAWIYPDQVDGWSPVSIAKMGSWFLLMIISFVLVAVVRRPGEGD